MSNTSCREFQEIYKNGQDLCEQIFNNSFQYVSTSSPNYGFAYTMWFFTASNPNSFTTQLRTEAGMSNGSMEYESTTDTCWLQTPGSTVYKTSPSANSIDMTECQPFRTSACCQESAVSNETVINIQFGDEFQWDRCGPLSPQCERFFVQQSCFSTCDPNAGLFRRYSAVDFPEMMKTQPNSSNVQLNLLDLPIQGDYCDAWFLDVSK